jgi:hypothetical protein
MRTMCIVAVFFLRMATAWAQQPAAELTDAQFEAARTAVYAQVLKDYPDMRDKKSVLFLLASQLANEAQDPRSLDHDNGRTIQAPRFLADAAARLLGRAVIFRGEVLEKAASTPAPPSVTPRPPDSPKPTAGAPLRGLFSEGKLIIKSNTDAQAIVKLVHIATGRTYGRYFVSAKPVIVSYIPNGSFQLVYDLGHSASDSIAGFVGTAAYRMVDPLVFETIPTANGSDHTYSEHTVTIGMKDGSSGESASVPTADFDKL